MLGSIFFAFLFASFSRAANVPVKPASPPVVIPSSAPWITVVRPAEGAVLPATAGDFIIGAVSDPQAVLAINGTSVPVASDGAYLAWLPIRPGPFTFDLSLSRPGQKPFTARRQVVVSTPPAPLPESPPSIDPASLSPNRPLGLRAGDWLRLRMKASRHRRAFARIPGGPWLAMQEADPVLGIYETDYLVRPGEDLPPSKIQYRLGNHWWDKTAWSRGTVSFASRTPVIGRVKTADSVLFTQTPAWGNLFYVAPGVALPIWGQDGRRLKLRIDPGFYGWLPASDLEILPSGFPIHRAVTGVITEKAVPAGTEVHIPLRTRVPFQAIESPSGDSLSLILYGAVSHTNWIVYDSSDTFLDSIRFGRESPQGLRLEIKLRAGRSLWGYHAEYSQNGSTLKVLLIRPPSIKGAGSPLAGLRIFLDPGHNPDHPGAIGPLGTREMDVNMAIANAVAKRLTSEGAIPILSRQNAEEEVDLAARPKLAWESRSDVFVSIHNNDMADGENPLASPHGYSIYYYQPGSLPLARAVHSAYETLVPLADEGVRLGNYLVLRPTEMPEILIESAYLILPDQEMDLLSPQFQNLLAKAIVSGLRRYFKTLRPAPSPAGRAPTRMRLTPKPHAAAKKPSAPKRRSSARKPAKHPSLIQRARTRRKTR